MSESAGRSDGGGKPGDTGRPKGPGRPESTGRLEGNGRSEGVGRPDGPPIQLVNEGHRVPFSKGLLATALTSTGLPPQRAYTVALDVEWQLLQGAERQVGVDELRALVEKVLEDSGEQVYLQRYRTWNRMAAEDRPVIVLIGGATGVGKSTIAAQVAQRLGIVRIISTDAIRQAMRAFFSETLMPSLHYSSYDAGMAVRIPVGPDVDAGLLGFMAQVEMVSVGIGAIIGRAIEERTSLVVEGVHMVPGMLAPGTIDPAGVLLLPLVVSVRDAELHRSHFLVREQQTSGKRALARYLQGFADIRRIQDFILERAETEGTFVVDNVHIDDSVGMVVDALYGVIDRTEVQAGER
jgi:2-phosphoglycerate kinase